MSADERAHVLTGTWKEGRIILDGPADWPDGCRVTVEPISDQVETLGITEEQWPRTPEAIAEWLAWFDSIEPIEMTPEGYPQGTVADTFDQSGVNPGVLPWLPMTNRRLNRI